MEGPLRTRYYRKTSQRRCHYDRDIKDGSEPTMSKNRGMAFQREAAASSEDLLQQRPYVFYMYVTYQKKPRIHLASPCPRRALPYSNAENHSAPAHAHSSICLPLSGSWYPLFPEGHQSWSCGQSHRTPFREGSLWCLSKSILKPHILRRSLGRGSHILKLFNIYFIGPAVYFRH